MPKLSLNPLKAAAQQNCDAWFYEECDGLRVFIRLKDTGPTDTCKLPKRRVRAYAAKFARAALGGSSCS
jgi:hypothetical protein